jgi:hypothetical protein
LRQAKPGARGTGARAAFVSRLAAAGSSGHVNGEQYGEADAMLSETQWVVLVAVLALVTTAVLALVMARSTRRRQAELRDRHGPMQRTL